MTDIPNPRVPFVDKDSGLITREWYNFLFLISDYLPGILSKKFKITSDGGYAVKLINNTGAVSVKGYLVTPTGTTINNSVKLSQINAADCIGVFLESGIADGNEAWVVVSGIADVYFSGSTTRGYLARVGVTADTGEVAGQAIAEIYPPAPPFATDKHFAEVGHVLETRTGAGLAKCVLHFN